MDNTFKVNDIIYSSYHGLMFVTEVLDISLQDPNKLGYKLRGPIFYKASELISNSNRYVNITEPNKWRLATDKDIIDKLVSNMCSFDLDEQNTLNIYPDDKAISLYNDSEGWIYLEESAIKSLKLFLKKEVSI